MARAYLAVCVRHTAKLVDDLHAARGDTVGLLPGADAELELEPVGVGVHRGEERHLELVLPHLRDDDVDPSLEERQEVGKDVWIVDVQSHGRSGHGGAIAPRWSEYLPMSAAAHHPCGGSRGSLTSWLTAG